MQAHAGNGLLAGLVSITASCAFVEGWSAVIIGVIGGAVYYGSTHLVTNVLKVDDPLEAVAVHAGCGMWGLIAVGFFAVGRPVNDFFGPGTDYGVIMGGSGKLLGAQLIALLVIAGWVIAHMVRGKGPTDRPTGGRSASDAQGSPADCFCCRCSSRSLPSCTTSACCVCRPRRRPRAWTSPTTVDTPTNACGCSRAT